MEIRQLRYFLDIAETEHLTQSANNLFVTQSTLSHGLRQLEQELGVSLFDRLGRGLKLSQAGLQFRDFALRAIKELESGRMALADLNGLKSGSITLGIFPTFLNTVLPKTVAAFNEDYPKVKVIVRSLRAGAIEDQLMRGQIDLGIGFYPTLNEDIETEPLFDEQLMLAMSPKNKMASSQVDTNEALVGIPMALLPRSYAKRRKIDAYLIEAGVKPLVIIEMESVEGLLGICRFNPNLATIVPERATRQYPDLYIKALDMPSLVRSAGLLWRRGTSRSAAAQEFANRLRGIDWLSN